MCRDAEIPCVLVRSIYYRIKTKKVDPDVWLCLTCLIYFLLFFVSQSHSSSHKTLIVSKHSLRCYAVVILPHPGFQQVTTKWKKLSVNSQFWKIQISPISHIHCPISKTEQSKDQRKNCPCGDTCKTFHSHLTVTSSLSKRVRWTWFSDLRNTCAIQFLFYFLLIASVILCLFFSSNIKILRHNCAKCMVDFLLVSRDF